METDLLSPNSKASTRRLPDLHEPWREPRSKQAEARVSLELDELEYLALCDMPRHAAAHDYAAWGNWNRRAMIQEYSAHLVRSSQWRQTEESETRYRHQSLVFKLPTGELILLWGRKLQVFAATPDRAWDLGEELVKRFIMPRKKVAHFYLTKRGRSNSVETEYVKLGEDNALPPEQLPLFYGADVTDWQDLLVKKMQSRKCGISLLQGPPGTGKTNFLRSFMAAHSQDFRFYYIPSSNFDVLRASEFVGFWSSQRTEHKDRTMVVIMEDAESVLATRQGGDRSAVSNLLNISDGLLGDFLRLHLICTMNADLHDLDSAILRPGRLVTRRHFGHVPLERAQALVQVLGRPLPPGPPREEYSLAELLNDPDPDSEKPHDKRILGFAPAA